MGPVRPSVPSNLSPSFSVVPVLQAFLYKPFTPSVIPRAFHYIHAFVIGLIQEYLLNILTSSDFGFLLILQPNYIHAFVLGLIQEYLLKILISSDFGFLLILQP